MRMLKIAGYVSLFVAFLVTGAVARDYGKAPRQWDQSQSMTQQDRFSSMNRFSSGILGLEGSGVYYMGTLSGIDLNNDSIIVKTQVPGLFGPQLRDIPFRLSSDTTVTVCFRSINICDTKTSGSEGVDMIASLEGLSSLASVDKNVVVIGEPDTGRVVHVELEYGV